MSSETSLVAHARLERELGSEEERVLFEDTSPGQTSSPFGLVLERN